MIHLSIYKTQRIVGDQYEDIYNLTLDQKDDSNIIKNVLMPVPLNSDLGIYLTSLISQVSNYKNNIIPNSIDEAKEIKNIAINNEWLDIEKIGWNSGRGYHLGITSSDVALIVGVYSLAKEASSLGLPLPNLISMDNTPIIFSSMEEMTTVLLEYGQARSILASTFADRRKAVKDATTIEEVGVI